MPSLSIIPEMRSAANNRNKSSSNDKKNREAPGSPWRPERPRNWLSMRRDSWRSVPTINKPPSSATPSPSLISVPRPAILVAIVTDPFWPAPAIISASFSWNLAFRTLCEIPCLFNTALSSSDCVIEVVPMSTGCPLACSSCTNLPTALYLARLVL